MGYSLSDTANAYINIVLLRTWGKLNQDSGDRKIFHIQQKYGLSEYENENTVEEETPRKDLVLITVDLLCNHTKP